PEPWAPFFDALIVGDGEEVIVEIIVALAAVRGRPRAERLAALARVTGVYVPGDFAPRYESGRFAGFDIRPGARRAERRIVPDIDRVPHPTCPVVPNARAVHDRLAVEVMRGCTRGCRFCQPGFLTRPLRERSVDNLMGIIEEGLATTGYDELTLLSLSSGDYSGLPSLLSRIEERDDGGRPLSVSLPSLRAESITDDMMTQIAKVRRAGFTIAPEAGSERLRRVLNKPIRDEQIFRACRTAVANGWTLVKLYFMVGLPTETDDDLRAIGRLCRDVLAVMDEGGKRAQVNVNLGVFVPKPFTPFAWEAQIEPAEARRRAAVVRDSLESRRIRLKPHDPEISLVEGLLCRGDRRVADVIERVVDDGGGFDGWTEGFSFDRWMRAFDACGLDWRLFSRELGEDEALPWDGVDALIEKEFLLHERAEAMKEAFTDDCRVGACTECGSCDHTEVQNRLAAEVSPVAFLGFAPKPVEPKTSVNGGPAPATLPPADLFRYRVRFEKSGEMRHLGHLELAPIVHRAVHRARLPIAYTQGFHKQPRVAFGPPLSAGIESRDEPFDLLLTEPLDTNDLGARLASEMPERLAVHDVESRAAREPSLFDTTVASILHAQLPDADEKTDRAIRAFADAETWPIEVRRKRKAKSIDARAFVSDIERTATGVRFRLRFDSKGSLSPWLALSAMLGIDETAARNLRVVKERTLMAMENAPSG
ncbi:TIGR03936 family radical SAM-associated protein, partial [bacterium]|nr:TIGR03936 family radical SAM-associated protein [bacterium]